MWRLYRIKQRFTEEGLDGALWDRRQVNRHRKLDDRSEAHLIALACSPAPEGHDHWTLRLLAGKVVELGLASSMSHEGVRKRLKKTFSSRGRSRSGALSRRVSVSARRSCTLLAPERCEPLAGWRHIRDPCGSGICPSLRAIGWCWVGYFNRA